MTSVALALASLGGLLHVMISAMESVLRTRKQVWRRFGIQGAEQAQALRWMAFNQGFYNFSWRSVRVSG